MPRSIQKSYGDPELGKVGPRPTFGSTEERRSGIIFGLSQANASSGLPLPFGESDDGDGPLGLALVPGERGVEGGLALEEVVPFGAEDFVGVHVDCLVPDLNLNFGVGFEVVVPVRVGIGATL